MIRQGRASEVVERYRTRLPEGHVHLAPDIPAKKLQKALATYGEGTAPDEVLCLVDTTLLGSARDGALLTATDVRVHDVAGEVTRVAYDDLTDVHQENGQLVLNGAKVLSLSMVEDQDTLVDLLREIPGIAAQPGMTPAPASAPARSSQAAPVPPPPPPPPACTLCGRVRPPARTYTVHTAIVRQSTRHSGFKEYETKSQTLAFRQHTCGVCEECLQRRRRRTALLFGAWAAVVVALAVATVVGQAMTVWGLVGLALVSLFGTFWLYGRLAEPEEAVKRAMIAERTPTAEAEVAFLPALHADYVSSATGQRIPTVTSVVAYSPTEFEKVRKQLEKS